MGMLNVGLDFVVENVLILVIVILKYVLEILVFVIFQENVIMLNVGLVFVVENVLILVIVILKYVLEILVFVMYQENVIMLNVGLVFVVENPNTCNSPLSCDRQICVDTFDGNSQCINLGNPCPFVNKCHNHECIDIDGIASCDLSIIDCDDGNECTIDSCSPSSGCTYDEITCDDGDRCTSEYCDPNFGCVIENDVDCDDGNPCTIDYCDEMRGCQI